MRRTTLIVAAVIALAFVFSLMMTRRLISTWRPERPPAAAPR
jgi:hypothetical protein